MRLPVRRTHFFGVALAVPVLVVLASYGQLQRDPPKLAVETTLPAATSTGDEKLVMPWPSKGAAAVAVAGTGTVGAAGDDRQRSLASLVKVMTAYVVLKDHPLKAGDVGPEIKIDEDDVQTYQRQLRNVESVIPVRAGTGITEKDLLQGLLIPSGNNYSYILAKWSSGSPEAFVQRMNEEAAALGMTQTHYDEPSGVSPASVSTARDQLKLAEAAMASPVLAGIVGAKQAQLPVVGTVFNVNSLLGQDNLVGIKTGWTEEAGACFLFAADSVADGKPARIFGVVMGQDTLADAFGSTRQLLQTVAPSLRLVPVVAHDKPAASLTSPWGAKSDALPAQDVSIVAWPGLNIETAVDVTRDPDSVKAKGEVGKLTVKAADQNVEVPLVARKTIDPPGLIWRLTRH
jgi:serine-type D-Ala-D-Ala carboxypeptidase (penicillin-binding protein 5/6)